MATKTVLQETEAAVHRGLLLDDLRLIRVAEARRKKASDRRGDTWDLMYAAGQHINGCAANALSALGGLGAAW